MAGDNGVAISVHRNAVSASYFETMQLPFREGRAFLPGAGGAGEAVINETLASSLAENGTAVGQTCDVLDERGELVRRLTIVGIAHDAKYHSLWLTDVPFLDESMEAGVGDSPAVIVRSRHAPLEVSEFIRREVVSINPSATVGRPQTGASRLAALTREQSYLGWLLGSVTAVALIVAAGGLMANLDLMVTQRVREIAIRQAVGATRRSVLLRVLRRGLWIALSALCLGLIGGIALQRWMAPLAPGVAPGDPWPMLFSLIAVLATSVSSVLGPA